MGTTQPRSPRQFFGQSPCSPQCQNRDKGRGQTWASLQHLPAPGTASPVDQYPEHLAQQDAVTAHLQSHASFSFPEILIYVKVTGPQGFQQPPCHDESQTNGSTGQHRKICFRTMITSRTMLNSQDPTWRSFISNTFPHRWNNHGKLKAEICATDRNARASHGCPVNLGSFLGGGKATVLS